MMFRSRAQSSWVLYDAANAAYALIVRTVFAALLFKYCADPVWGEVKATSAWGYAASLAGIAAGAISITLGSFADLHVLKKKLIGLFVTVGVLGTVAFSFVQQGQAWTALSLSFLTLCCYMIANSFYDALLLDVSPRGSRDTLSSVAYAAGYVGGMIPFGLCLLIAYCLKDTKNSILPMRLSFLIAAAWWGFFSLPLFKNVKEHRHTHSKKSGGLKAVVQSFRRVMKNKELRNFLIAYFLYIDGVGTIYMMAAPISADIGVSSNVLLLTILGLQVIAVPCTIAYGKLAQKFHSRTMLYIAIGTYVVIALLAGALAFLPKGNAQLWDFLALSTLIGTAQGGIQSLSRSLFSRIVPPEHAAECFGFYNLFGKFTTILGPILVGIAGALWGKTVYGIVLLIVPFCAGAWLLSTIDFSRTNHGGK